MLFIHELLTCIAHYSRGLMIRASSYGAPWRSGIRHGTYMDVDIEELIDSWRLTVIMYISCAKTWNIFSILTSYFNRRIGNLPCTQEAVLWLMCFMIRRLGPRVDIDRWVYWWQYSTMREFFYVGRMTGRREHCLVSNGLKENLVKFVQ